jgi:hypothetical protein
MENIDQIKLSHSIEFFAKQVVEGFITGKHKSPYHGFSVEFAEHRLYNNGESTRHIDWKLFARSDKLFVKRFEEETNLTSEDYTLLDNVSPLEEEYVGSNGVRYKHIYYVAFYNVVKGHGCVKELDGVKGHGCVKELSINLEKYEQFSEIADIAWLTIDEGFDKIRKEQTTKKGILEQIKKFNDMWTNDFNFKE